MRRGPLKPTPGASLTRLMPMTRPQWWLDETALDILALCEHLDARSNPNPDYIDDFDPPHGTDRRRLIAIAESEHLLRSDRAWADGGHPDDPIVIMPPGLRHLASVREHRARPHERVSAARQALLLWAYDHAMSNAEMPMVNPSLFLRASPPYNYWGEPFTDASLVEATDYLVGARLLELWGQPLANGRPQNVQITQPGKDCVERYDGRVGAYLDRHTSASSTINNTQHFYGDFTGQNAQGENITQTQHVGVDPDALAAIFTNLRHAAAQVENPQDRSDLELAIDDLEREAGQPVPDPSQVSKRIGMLARTAARVGNTAVTVAATAATSGLIEIFGDIVT